MLTLLKRCSELLSFFLFTHGLFLSLQVTLPVYLNFTRADLIFTVDFDIATKEDPHHFYERGVAVLCTE